MNFRLLLFYLLISIKGISQTLGCTDVLAKNYNSNATINDASCIYKNESINFTQTFTLNQKLKETSGLIQWNNKFWTHNDDTDTNLYALDTINGEILETYNLPYVTNTDWEEISQDENYLYIGDFGNNASGNRTDLNILRIEKNSLLASNPVIDKIEFKYSNQTNFTRQFANKTNFDCEAFVVTKDSIFLFTKEWKSKKTTIYSLPKMPGKYVAQQKEVYNIEGLVTGATYLESKNILALCGYTRTGKPFVNLFYDFKETHFFAGNKRKINLKTRFLQIEGISTNDGLHYYITNEYLKFVLANNPQQMHVLDLSKYLKSFINLK